MALGSLTTAFLGGLQASLSVLLTIFYGVLAAQFKILSESSAKDLSKLCVKMTLPALLLANIGSQLNPQNITRAYLPVLVFSMIYTLISIGLGIVATRIFKFPSWTTPAVAFNNTVSLPLVLVQSLDSTGILSRLVVGPDDSTSQAILRAKSYFLVCSLVGNSLTFAIGPKLLDSEEAAEPEPSRGKGDDGPVIRERPAEDDEDAERGVPPTEDRDCRRNEGEPAGDDDDDEEEEEEEEEEPNEQTSLLPDVVNHHLHRVTDISNRSAHRVWDHLPGKLRSVLAFLYMFLVAPLIGAIVGAIIGLAPPLRRIFFNGTDHGGIFGPWLTSSVKNVGDLFAALQLLIVGCKLSTSLRRMKEGKDSGDFRWGATAYVFAIRFVFWPLVSIPIIWALATKTSVLGHDPMLWFCLMMMPCGPPAIKLSALADVHGTSAHDKMSIAKLLIVAYAVSPVICFAVVGSLRASEAAIPRAASI